MTRTPTPSRTPPALPEQPADLAELDVEDLIFRPGFYRVVITPATAKRLIERNVLNRKPKDNRVDDYANDMKTDRWRLTNQGIGFDTRGTLIDGQMRLLACIEADTPFPTLVATGLEPEARDVVDVGVKRTLADVLRMHGYHNVMQLSGGAALRVRYENLVQSGKPYTQYNGRTARTRINHEGMKAYIADKPSLVDASRTMHLLRATFRSLPASSIVAFESMITDGGHADDYQEFVNALVTGANLTAGDPRLVLRNYLTRSKPTRKGGPNSMYYLGVLIKTWNDWKVGRSREVILLRENEIMPAIGDKDPTDARNRRDKSLRAARQRV